MVFLHGIIEDDISDGHHITILALGLFLFFMWESWVSDLKNYDAEQLISTFESVRNRNGQSPVSFF